MSEKNKVIAADPMAGDLIIHFSDGKSVLFHADYLEQIRHKDENQVLSNELADDEDLQEE